MDKGGLEQKNTWEVRLEQKWEEAACKTNKETSKQTKKRKEKKRKEQNRKEQKRKKRKKRKEKNRK
jgi:hypothetical protein